VKAKHIKVLYKINLHDFVNLFQLSQLRRLETMTPSFVSLHVAPNTEGLSTALVGTFEWLLASMRVGMNAETGRPRKCFIACLTDISVLRLRK
jgi:hypothetical protein